MSTVAYADDTEIFFAQAAGSADTFPNIMFILDDSGSMGGTRLTNMKAAMNAIIDSSSDINVGMMNFDAPAGLGTLLYPVSNINIASERIAMKAAVNSLVASGGTPLVGAHYEAVMAMTGGPIKRGSQNYTSPMVGECQNNHIILLSDGQANSHPGEQLIRDLTGDTTCAVSGGDACGVELATWLNNTDLRSNVRPPDLPGTQNITTYTIGFVQNSPYLAQVGPAGGGEYFEAQDAAELQAVFEDIIGRVADVDTTFVAPTTSVSQLNRLTLDTDLYFSLFKPLAETTWKGNLKRYQLGYADGVFKILDKNANDAVDPTTGFFKEGVSSFWTDGTPDGDSVVLGGAASELSGNALDGPSRRRVFTYMGDINRDGPTTLSLTTNFSQEVHEGNGNIGNNDLGGGAGTNANRDTFLRWMRGYDVKDEDEDGIFAEARAHMGDPLHSTPAVVRYENDSTVFIGTNEGFLHAIDTENGKEIYSFMPQELLRNIPAFFINDRNIKHPYGLDGDITIWHDDNDGNGIVDGTDKAYLYIGMRRGGRDYYAFDVTNRNELRFLWQIEGGQAEYVRLGQTWSKPFKAKINMDGNDVDVLIFGGGYNPNQDSDKGNSRRTDNYGNAIYIVNALTGELIWDAKHNVFRDLDYSIPAAVRVMDVDGNGLADRMYVGDMGGQVWRFDINQYYQSGGDPLVEGGKLADLGGRNAPNSRRFFNQPDVALINQQGERFMSISMGSGWRAHPLDTTISEKFFMIRDNNPLYKPEGYGIFDSSSWRPMEINDLVNVSSSFKKTLSELPHGWYIDLEESGEKSLSKSITVNNQVLFTTYQPGVASSTCEPAVGAGSVYAVSVVNGDPVMDLNSRAGGVATAFEKADRKKPLGLAGIPPGPSAVIAMVNGEIETGIMLGPQSMEEVDFGALTSRTYWLDQNRGPETPDQINASN